MNRIVMALLTVSLLAAVNWSVQAQQDEGETGSRGPGLQFAFSATMMNSYARGNLDDFFHSISGDPTRDVDSGSAAYFDLSMVIPFPDATESFSMGIGIGALLCNSHGLWGTRIDFGGRAEIALRPWVMYVSMPTKISLANSSMLYLAFDPAFVMGFVTGEVTTLGGVQYDIVAAPKPGFQIPMGIDLKLSGNLSLTLRFGYRMAKGDVQYRDETSSTGYSQFKINDELVVADLSGVFATYGITIGF